MTDYLIKRYLLEKFYEEDKNLSCSEIHLSNMLYKEYCEGNLDLDIVNFRMWLENLKQNKLLFGNYIINQGMLSDNILHEISESNKIKCLNDSEIILSPVGEDCYTSPYISPIKELIVDGIYDNQLIYLANVIKNKGSFVIGYCGNDNEYTKRVLEYYKKILKFLPKIIEKKQIKFQQDQIGNSKIIVLTNKKR